MTVDAHVRLRLATLDGDLDRVERCFARPPAGAAPDDGAIAA